jgi:hypothetical protein
MMSAAKGRSGAAKPIQHVRLCYGESEEHRCSGHGEQPGNGRNVSGDPANFQAPAFWL